jgi:hypothetical protein
MQRAKRKWCTVATTDFLNLFVRLSPLLLPFLEHAERMTLAETSASLRRTYHSRPSSDPVEFQRFWVHTVRPVAQARFVKLGWRLQQGKTSDLDFEHPSCVHHRLSIFPVRNLLMASELAASVFCWRKEGGYSRLCYIRLFTNKVASHNGIDAALRHVVAKLRSHQRSLQKCSGTCRHWSKTTRKWLAQQK